MKSHLIKNPQKYKYLIILDFEANCNLAPGLPQEIIEFPCVIYDIYNDLIDRTKDFSQWVKPQIPLTDFCTQLTTITQTQVDTGYPLDAVLKMHQLWMHEHNLINESLFVTCGDWDLQNELPHHCKYLQIEYPSYFKQWANIKKLYSDFYKTKSYGMKSMLDKLNIPLTGTHHRGIDDCANIAAIAKRMVLDGCKFNVTNRIKKVR